MCSLNLYTNHQAWADGLNGGMLYIIWASLPKRCCMWMPARIIWIIHQAFDIDQSTHDREWRPLVAEAMSPEECQMHWLTGYHKIENSLVCGWWRCFPQSNIPRMRLHGQQSSHYMVWRQKCTVLEFGNACKINKHGTNGFRGFDAVFEGRSEAPD